MSATTHARRFGSTLLTSALIGALSLSSLGVAGCATPIPPKELVDARTAYERAKASRAKELAPAQLDTAKQALRQAEMKFEDKPEDQETRDFAYIAHRKSLLAEASGEIEANERRREAAEKEFKELSQTELERARDAVKNAKNETDAERRAREAAEKGRTDAEKARDAAEKARQDAERQLAAALASLKEIAAISEEKRGMVITLSGAVLFVSGKSELLPIAKEKMNQVASALKDQGYPNIRIEGHTDSVGSAEENRKLSLARAESVKSHLVSQGYPAAKIETAGLGPDRPVADNGTPEGRANNRRVEIIVAPKK